MFGKKKKKGCPVCGLITVLVVLAGIGLAIYAAYKYFSPAALDDFEDEFDDEFEDDFEDENLEDAELEAKEPATEE